MSWEQLNPDHVGISITLKYKLHDDGCPNMYSDLSGSAVAEHKEGFVQKERPHYHIWIPEPWTCKAQGLKLEKRYKQQIREFFMPRISGVDWNKDCNALYCVKHHDSFHTWVRYVTEEQIKKGSWYKWNCRGEPPPMRQMDDLILPVVNVETPTNVIHYEVSPVVAKTPKDASKREAAHIRFYNWLLQQEIEDELTIHEITEYWVEWSHGAYELRNVTAPIRYAWYMLQTDKKTAKERLVREIHRKLFSDF